MFFHACTLVIFFAVTGLGKATNLSFVDMNLHPRVHIVTRAGAAILDAAGSLSKRHDGVYGVAACGTVNSNVQSIAQGCCQTYGGDSQFTISTSGSLVCNEGVPFNDCVLNTLPNACTFTTAGPGTSSSFSAGCNGIFANGQDPTNVICNADGSTTTTDAVQSASSSAVDTTSSTSAIASSSSSSNVSTVSSASSNIANATATPSRTSNGTAGASQTASKAGAGSLKVSSALLLLSVAIGYVIAA